MFVVKFREKFMQPRPEFPATCEIWGDLESAQVFESEKEALSNALRFGGNVREVKRSGDEIVLVKKIKK